ncbi:MAG: helix-turn-helix transcriptional regulator [bacterium]
MSTKIKQDICIGNNLKYLRKKSNLSQEQLAIKLQLEGISISREIISQMERGKYSIRISLLKQLKIIFNCEYNDFFYNI